MHLAVAAQGDAQRRDPVAKERHQVGLPMRVAMRIDVRRHAAHQAMELLQLSMILIAHCRHLTDIEFPFVLAPHVPVKPTPSLG